MITCIDHLEGGLLQSARFKKNLADMVMVDDWDENTAKTISINLDLDWLPTLAAKT